MIHQSTNRLTLIQMIQIERTVSTAGCLFFLNYFYNIITVQSGAQDSSGVMVNRLLHRCYKHVIFNEHNRLHFFHNENNIILRFVFK